MDPDQIPRIEQLGIAPVREGRLAASSWALKNAQEKHGLRTPQDISWLSDDPVAKVMPFVRGTAPFILHEPKKIVWWPISQLGWASTLMNFSWPVTRISRNSKIRRHPYGKISSSRLKNIKHVNHQIPSFIGSTPMVHRRLARGVIPYDAMSFEKLFARHRQSWKIFENKVKTASIGKQPNKLMIMNMGIHGNTNLITKHFMLSLRNNFGPPLDETQENLWTALSPSFNRFAEKPYKTLAGNQDFFVSQFQNLPISKMTFTKR